MVRWNLELMIIIPVCDIFVMLDFMFELTEEEWESVKGSLRSQIVILKKTQRGKHGKYLPFVFTKQGVSMLSSVLNSPQAIQVNILIIRVFVKMREWSANYSELLAKINELQQSESEQNLHIGQIYQIIDELLKPKLGERTEIGFKSK